MHNLFNNSVMSHLQTLQEELTQLKMKDCIATDDIPDRNDSVSKINRKKVEILQEDGNETYPQDCYSLIALNGPNENQWPKRKIISFVFGLTAFLFQIAFLILMIWSRVDPNTGDGERDNPTKNFFQFIPANTKAMIRASQIISIWHTCCFQMHLLWIYSRRIGTFRGSSQEMILFDASNFLAS